ncbi:hypothetical protein BRD56_00665 [Thermoplasmatales archaeon SW_10_69_26]|nr:MAG: hypothetical protein BRD56_00665 [Thermoplasmatales archaeon SW_10_69_26]
MHARERLVVADPQVPDSQLAEAAQVAGAWALVDRTRPYADDRLAEIDPSRTLVRVRPEDDPIPEAGIAVIATWQIDAGSLPQLRQAVDAWQAAGVPAAVEVRDVQEARRARDAGADALVARGGEGPGRASDTSSLVLLPALDEFDLPTIAWGGAGPSATGALLVHADMVVLDAQLYGLPEAGLSDAWTRALGAFDGGDVRALGSTLDEPFYALARPADEHVHDAWEDEQGNSSELGPATRRAHLRALLDEERGHWTEDPHDAIHALGADAAHAGFFAEMGTLEAALDHLETRVREQADKFPLTEGSPLAQAHGTDLPVVQGAMANVSEEPAFAKAVADAGGLPFLAFASLRPEWAEDLMDGTLDTLDEDQAFGCGIIGLDLNEDKRDAHQRLIREEQPDKALIAAGTVEQARELEDAGVDTYLHTPSRGLVRSAIEAGLDHVVVEGNECGGHIGKLPSLVLWDVALQEVASVGEDVKVLLAGGISDDETAAMAGTLAAGVDEARVGVLMGTAYLATEEIVATGATTPEYQRLVLASRETEVTGETVGIRARSAPTPFTDRVQELEQELVNEGVDLDERKERVEDENLGATRLAAQGVTRQDDGTYDEVSSDEQLQEGNYLMGQGAELIEDTYTIEDLHRRVTDDAAQAAQALDERLAQPPAIGGYDEVPEDAIAIVGLGCIMPDAGDPDQLWDNVLEGRVAVDEIPEDRWPIDPQTHLADTRDVSGETYTVLGGFVDEDDVDFDPIEHRIPPNVADQMDDSQKWAVHAAGDALADAGLLEDENRNDWAVILGNAMGGEQRMWTSRRLALEEAKQAIADDDADEDVLATLEQAQDDLPEINEDTMPGELANIVASRVCSVYDIGGPARTVDAACASSLAALEDAVTLLHEDRVDVALTGGVDRSMDPGTFAKFSAIGALSPEGSFPFDERASGFVMGEGAGCLVLKRLEDAIEDGDHVYACIRGVGSSSDGKGKGITAPNPSGQRRALENAFDDADVDPEDLTLVEAHGTGTPVGDPTEVQTLEAVLDEDPGEIGLGSIKANIGHLKAAAGAAGLIKAAKAIDEATLPPTVVDDPTSEVAWDDTPLSLVTEPTDWSDDERLAGVSAFGFGGTNSHVVLSAPPQARGEDPEDPTEPRLASAPDRQALREEIAKPPQARRFDPEDPVRVAHTPDVDQDTIEQAITGELPPQLALVQGVAVGDLTDTEGKLGLVFPGQGSQYPQMALQLAEHFPAAREVLEEADQVLTPLLGRPLTELLAKEGEDGIQALTPTEVCQPAVLAADVAMLRVLEELGVDPDIVAGHSLGEYAALVAAGTLSFEDALHAVSARGREMADVEVDDPGGLVALETDRAGALDLIQDLDAWPANVNGPEQTVVAGTTPALETLAERADESDVRNSQLQVSAAFHSPIVEPAQAPLREVLERIPVDPPETTVIANATGDPYPEDPDAIRDLLAEQVASAVEWVETMEAFDDANLDMIVETGPGRVLSGLAQANADHIPAVPTMHERTGELASFSRARLALTAAGLADPPTAEADEPQPSTQLTPDPRPTPAQARPAEPRQVQTPRTVVSGVSLGVPGVEDPFDPAARQALLEGENLLSEVPDGERRTMADMGVQRLDKNGDGGPSFEAVDDPEDVVSLAGRIADVDLSAYGVDEDWLEDADRTARLAVAAALEALSDASIPLVPDEHETSTGTTLQEGWSLPEPLQAETGVVLASAFPGYDNLLDIVDTQAPSPTPAGADPDTLVDAIDRLGDHLDAEGRAELMDWAAQTHLDTDRAEPEPAHASTDEFPRDFLFRVLGMGHAQVAQLVDARGPNLHVNAACASTTSALALAQDWIEQGRCERVIVLGADVAGNEKLLPWIGSGFMAAGAASTADTVDEAALPFDRRRNGMLVGSGAVGLVVETHEAATERGLTPLAEIAETSVANSAFHGARLDPDHVSAEVEAFLDQVRQDADLSRSELAEDLVFVSHEPATPPRGGSAEAEIDALQAALGDDAEDVLVTNTKGLTGHAMGAGLEDGIAVDLLRRRQAPPVANLEQPDPAFETFTFSEGGPTDRSRSLRFAAGFGSQVAMACFERIAEAPGQIDQATFEDWLSRAVGDATVTRQDRLLRAVDPDRETQTTQTQTREAEARPAAARQPGKGSTSQPLPDRSPEPTAEGGSATAQDGSTANTDGVDPAQVRALLVDLVSRKTGYPEDVIDPGMDLEADLGVDTVKQAEVLAEAREELGIPPIEGMSLADVPTVDDAAQLFAEHVDGADGATTNGSSEADIDADEAAAEPASTNGSSGTQPTETDGPDVSEVEALLVDLVSRKTGYPEDVIDPGMDLEADLGVDTVKQAEVLAEAREELGIPPIEGMSLADVPTVDDAARLLAEHAGTPASDADTASENGSADTHHEADAIQRTAWRWRPAQPPEGSLQPDQVTIEGPLPEATQARLGDASDGPDAPLHVVSVTAEADPEALTDLLVHLQDVPEEARTVLVAAGEDASARGLPALAGTLRAEEIDARAVIVGEDVTDETLVAEILADTTTDVRLDGSLRQRPAPAPTDPEAELDLAEPITVLAPGGLGAAVQPCLAELADRHEVRLALVGRSPLVDPELDPDDEDEIQDLREQMLAEAQRTGEDPTPAEIEERVQREVRKARRAHAYQALAAVAETSYHRADATDGDALAEVVATVEDDWGAIDLVVHGVGVDRSRGFADKTRDEMQLVLDTKLTPVHKLTDELPEAHHVAFGSIAGAYGNPGQADYALANGCLPGLLAPVDGTLIHWTAWDAAGGMADDDTVRAVLEDREVTFLAPERGAEVFTDAFAQPGTFLVADQQPRTPHTGTDELHLTGEEAFLDDHQVAGRPLVPGVRYLQALRQATAPDASPVEALHEVGFTQPAWITEPTTLRVEATGEAWQVTQNDTVHARARAGPGPGVKPVDRADPETDPIAAEAIYERLFHGPSFQVLTRARPGEDHVRAQADLTVGGASPHALAIEAAMQAAGLTRESRQLPVGIKTLSFEAAPRQGQVRVDARLVAADATGSTWDATVRDGEEPIVHVRGLRLQRTDANQQVTGELVSFAPDGVALSGQPVDVLDPRDPRGKREAEREAGTHAAERTLQEAFGDDASLDRDDGRPVVDGAEGSVSITHGHGLAIAAARQGSPIGIDLERIEDRSDAWREDSLTSDERAMLADAEIETTLGETLAWTLKEAAAKALGTGLEEPAQAYEVTHLAGDSACIHSPEGGFQARWTTIGDLVLSLAEPEA